MSVTYKFTSMGQLADYLAEAARRIRARVPNASSTSKRIMQAEACAYEQSAEIVRNAEFYDEADTPSPDEFAAAGL